MLIRKTVFWISVILAIGVLAIIIALTEQNPVQTSTLSSAVNNAIVAQHDCEAGDGATALSNTDTSVSSSAFAGVGKVMLSYASVRIWAHTVDFLPLVFPSRWP